MEKIISLVKVNAAIPTRGFGQSETTFYSSSHKVEHIKQHDDGMIEIKLTNGPRVGVFPANIEFIQYTTAEDDRPKKAKAKTKRKAANSGTAMYDDLDDIAELD